MVQMVRKTQHRHLKMAIDFKERLCDITSMYMEFPLQGALTNKKELKSIFLMLPCLLMPTDWRLAPPSRGTPIPMKGSGVDNVLEWTVALCYPCGAAWWRSG